MSDAGTYPPHDALVLAGGGGTRLGGVDKATLVVAGLPLLQRVLAAARWARRVVVVGPVEVPYGVLRVVEDPPGGGPVAGIAAGFAALRRDEAPAWTLVVAVDQPDAAAAAESLLSAAASAPDPVDLLCHTDAGGHPQWLLAAYRTASLGRALAGVGAGHGTSVRRLVSELTVGEVVEGAEHVGDVDTWEDHRGWEQRLAREDGRLG